MGRYITVTAEVDVDLDEFDDVDIANEFHRRNLKNTSGKDEIALVLNDIHEKRRLGKDYQRELDNLIYGVIGKVV
jgi:hypothetical protein